MDRDIEIIKALIERSRKSYLDVLEGVTQEVSDWLPPRDAHPIRMSSVHILWIEDRLVNVVLNNTTTIWEQLGFQEKTGIKPGRIPDAEWARSTRIDIEEIKNKYMKEVFISTDSYIGRLNSTDLDTIVERKGPTKGMKISDVFILLANHSANHIGEIASQKGAQGIKGYTF